MTKIFFTKPFLCFLFIIFVAIPNLNAQTFTGSFDLIATQKHPNGNVRSDTISYYFGNNKTALIIYGKRNNPDMRMIFNSKDSTITSLFEMNGKKGGFILPMDKEYWPGITQAFRTITTGANKPNYTGKIREIEDYSCREITAENDNYIANLWVTDSIQLSMTRVLSYQSVGKGKSKKEIELFDEFGVTELPVKMYLKSKKEKADVEINLINFKYTLDKNVFSTEGHKLSNVD